MHGERARGLRRQRGMSRKAMAVRAGLSQAAVARLGSGPGVWRRGRTLARIAAALGVHISDLAPVLASDLAMPGPAPLPPRRRP